MINYKNMIFRWYFISNLLYSLHFIIVFMLFETVSSLTFVYYFDLDNMYIKKKNEIFLDFTW